MNVVHATHWGTHAFVALSLETGSEAVIVTTPLVVCAENGCRELAKAHGLCTRHYMQRRSEW
jgi:hypothetical protein